MTLSNREYEKPSSASSGFDFSRSSWLDFRNFSSFDKVGYKISKLDGINFQNQTEGLKHI